MRARSETWGRNTRSPRWSTRSRARRSTWAPRCGERASSFDPLTFVALRVLEVSVAELERPARRARRARRERARSSGRWSSRRICSTATRPDGTRRRFGGHRRRYALSVGFSTIDELEEALRGADYLPDRGLSTALFLSLALVEAGAARGRGGGREDGGREGARNRPRRAADPPAVLRGARRRPRRLRVELPAPAAPHPRRAGGHRARGGALRAGVPDPPAAARGDRQRRAGRAPDRRDRPRRRGVRGVPARGALRLPDHDPRARHDRRPPAAER